MCRAIQRLVAGFGEYVDRSHANRQFSGSSDYFHVKALNALRSHAAAVNALEDEDFFDYMYATLASWGLRCHICSSADSGRTRHGTFAVLNMSGEGGAGINFADVAWLTDSSFATWKGGTVVNHLAIQ